MPNAKKSISMKSIFCGVSLGVLFMLPLAGTCAPKPSECVRSKPAPVFNGVQPGVRSHRFVPVSDHEASEYAVLTSGESMDIRHGGCEYFVTTFRFQSGLTLRNVKSRHDAYMVAATLLRRLQQLKESSGFDLALAASTLDVAARRNSEIEFGEPLAVEGGETDFLQTQVQVDEVGRKPGNEFIQISLFKGPL